MGFGSDGPEGHFGSLDAPGQGASGPWPGFGAGTSDVSSTSGDGTSPEAARVDHFHKGVHSVNGLFGDVQVSGSIRLDGVNTGAAQLSTLASATLTAGQPAWVESLQALFILEQTSVAAVALVVVAASGKAGYAWVRQIVRNPVWEVVTTWFLNASTGSDEATGVTAGAPLATWAELRRRLSSANLGTLTVTVQADMATGDSMILDNVTGTVSAVGTVNVTNTLTVTSAQARSAAGSLANEITVTGFDFSTFVGTLLRVQGTSNYAAITKAPSLGVARLGELFNGGAQASATGVGAGAVVELVNQTRAATAVRPLGRVVFNMTDLKWTAGLSHQPNTDGGTSTINRCVVSGGTIALAGVTGDNYDSCVFNGAFNYTASKGALFAGCAWLGAGAVSFANGCLGATIRSGVFQGKGFSFSNNALFEQKGDLGVFDLPAAAVGMTLTFGSRYSNDDSGAFYGGGNSGTSTGVALSFGSTGFYGIKASWTANMGNGVSTAAGNTAFAALPLAINSADGTGFFGT